MVVSAGYHGQVIMWDVTTGQALFHRQLRQPVGACTLLLVLQAAPVISALIACNL